jgi:ribokinase
MIVVIGSLNVDLVVRVPRFPQPGETLLGGDYARHPGGKGANQAVAAARAGGRVRMVGRVGRDAFGDALLRGLAEDGIDEAAVTALDDAPTGVAFISVDASAQNCIIVSPGANGRLTPEELRPADLEGAAAVLLQLEIPLETTLHAATLARRAGARVILNLAPAEALTPEQLHDVDVLLVNESEAALLLGEEASAVAREPQRAAGRLSRLVPAAVVTLGPAGAAWAEGRDTGLAPGQRVEAVDTTAAGDAFAGALAVRSAAGAALAEAVRFANAAGALATTRPGAQPSLPNAAAIERLLARRS